MFTCSPRGKITWYVELSDGVRTYFVGSKKQVLREIVENCFSSRESLKPLSMVLPVGVL